MEILRVFGTNLRKYREEKNISQEKFAEMVGLHRTISVMWKGFKEVFH